jgi:hypothetical protein
MYGGAFEVPGQHPGAAEPPLGMTKPALAAPRTGHMAKRAGFPPA